ncbi:hypothetical protein NKG05_16915 [Oerskovia sp. M15]
MRGAGPVGIIGGLTGMFALVAFMGGPLRADLRIAAVMGPLLIFAAAVPRLVAETSRPRRSLSSWCSCSWPHFSPARPTLRQRGDGAGDDHGVRLRLRTDGWGRSSAGDRGGRRGVAVALILRILMGISDPSKQTREQVAAVLVADDPSAATATAFSTWLSDGRQRWLADALEGASRYRLALHAADLAATGGPDDAALRGRAHELAEEMKAKPRRDKPVKAPLASPASAVAEAPSPTPRALDSVEQAIQKRDTTKVTLDRDRRHQLQDAVLHPRPG